MMIIFVCLFIENSVHRCKTAGTNTQTYTPRPNGTNRRSCTK